MVANAPRGAEWNGRSVDEWMDGWTVKMAYRKLHNGARIDLILRSAHVHRRSRSTRDAIESIRFRVSIPNQMANEIDMQFITAVLFIIESSLLM